MIVIFANGTGNFNMANLLTRIQLAKLINQSPAYIAVNVKRGKLIEDFKDGLSTIDTDHPINKRFLTNRLNQSNESQISKVIDEAQARIDKDKEFNIEIPIDDIKINIGNLDQLKKKEEIRKIRAATLLMDLEYKKKKAKVLPLDFVIEWSGRNIRGVFGETINFGNALIEQICNDIGAGTEVKLKYKKKLKQGLNELVKNGIKNQEPEALEYAQEYAYLNKW
jgi:hypothetical protein